VSLSLSLSSLFLFVVVFQTMMEKMKEEERVLSSEQKNRVIKKKFGWSRV